MSISINKLSRKMKDELQLKSYKSDSFMKLMSFKIRPIKYRHYYYKSLYELSPDDSEYYGMQDNAIRKEKIREKSLSKK